MIRIAICDDIVIILKTLKKVLLEYDFGIEIEIDVFQKGEDLYVNSIKKKYDIIILDIELSKNKDIDNGLIISNRIKDIYPEVIIIFFSGYSQYEHTLLNFEPFRFLRKPVDNNELIKSIKAAIKRINGWDDKYIVIRSKERLHFKLKLNEIIYIMSQSPYIIIKYLENDSFQIRGKIEDIQTDIEKISNDFCRHNKSFLVNKKYIKKFSSKELTLNNGEKISISRKYAAYFFKSIE